MIRFVYPEDCGNAPRKQQLRDLTIALAKGEADQAKEFLSDQVVWEVVGEHRIVGPDTVCKAFGELAARGLAELRIHNIVTHGYIAALNATLTMHDGARVEYCDVYVFSGASKTAKVKEVRSYRIPLGPAHPSQEGGRP